MGRDVVARVGRMLAGGGGGMVAEPEPFTLAPGAAGPDRAGHEIATAGRADIVQHGLDAVGAVGAFVGTDPRVGAVGRQVAVAEFATRAQFEHGGAFVEAGLFRASLSESRAAGKRLRCAAGRSAGEGVSKRLDLVKNNACSIAYTPGCTRRPGGQTIGLAAAKTNRLAGSIGAQ